jgi:NADH-quinone oxidoreductase subunit E
MLTEEETKEIDEELSHYPDKQAVCVEALKIVQRHRGWVSDDSLRDIAAYLELTIDELDSVATFYPLIFRKPVGKHVILICDSVSCWITGYEQVRQSISDNLGINFGETTEDGRFTLLPIPCLGACDHAPAMIVDNELYGDLDAEKVSQVLAEYKE